MCAFYCAVLREIQGHVSKINLFLNKQKFLIIHSSPQTLELISGSWGTAKAGSTNAACSSDFWVPGVPWAPAPSPPCRSHTGFMHDLNVFQTCLCESCQQMAKALQLQERAPDLTTCQRQLKLWQKRVNARKISQLCYVGEGSRGTEQLLSTVWSHIPALPAAWDVQGAGTGRCPLHSAATAASPGEQGSI